jgi:hypothetical protein
VRYRGVVGGDRDTVSLGDHGLVFGGDVEVSAAATKTLTLEDTAGGQLTEIDANTALLSVTGDIVAAGKGSAARLIFPSKTTSTATGTRNDLNVSTNTVFRYGGGAAVVYTGFTCTDQVDGRVIILRNASGFTMTLSHEDALSVDANRITCPGSANVVIPNRGGAILVYDATAARWYVASYT